MEDDGDVGGVEEFDGVSLNDFSSSLRGHSEVDFESLEVDDDEEDTGSSDQRVDVGSSLSVEGVGDSSEFVGVNNEGVEQVDQ